MNHSNPMFRAARSSLVLLAAAACAATAEAQKVTIVSVGNETPTGGWCDVNNQTLAQGASRSYSITGRIDFTQFSSVNGKYRMKTQTDNFEWVSGEPAVAFTQSSSSPVSFSIKARSGAVAGTHTISFVAVDDVGAESAGKTCKITVSGPTAKTDLSTAFQGFLLQGENTWVRAVGDVPSGNQLTLRVVIRNNSPVTAPAVRVSMSRLDHTCGGYPVAVRTAGTSAAYHTVDVLVPGVSATKEFTDTNPPKPDRDASTPIGTTAMVCYKVGLNTSTGGYYTDSINTNNSNTHYIKFVATNTSTTTVAKFGDYLYPKFLNAKCLNCHQFTDNTTTKRSVHNSQDRTTTSTVVTNSANCSGCHDATPTCSGAPGCVANWHAAPATANWTGKTSAQTCTLIKTAPLPSGHTMSSHLKTDPFVVWAVEKALISLTEWRTKVDEWINGGQLCE